MRASLLILALALPASAAAVIYDQPDFARIFSRVVSVSDEGTTCTFRPGFTQCSDGRTITTTRASAVPCETSPGVWTYAPAGQACVSVRGLESWGATDNYIPHPNSVDTWTTSGSGTLDTLPGETGLLFEKGSTVGAMQLALGLRPEIPGGEAWRLFFDVKAAGPNPAPDLRALLTSGPGCIYVTPNIGSSWTAESATCTLSASASANTTFDRSSAAAGSFALRNIKLTKTFTTPGRPCWQASGAAPFTCAADVHTISTTDFPTTEGCIALTVTWGETEARQRGLIDGLTIETNGALKQGSVTSSALAWIVAQAYRVEMCREGGIVSLHRDGVQVASGASAAWSWGATATLGGTGATALNGGIGSLRLQ